VSAPTKRPWQLTDITEPLSVYRPVLALTILRQRAEHLEILAGVRTGAANITHPGVVSVPTQRVPQVIAESWLSELGRPLGPELAGQLGREVEYLLARKLGLADALELRQVRLSIHALSGWQGTSVIGEDQDGLITEDLTMFNACVEVVEGDGLVPPETASYRPLVWARSTDFLRMVETREVAALNADLDELLFCVYGLCLESTARTLRLVNGMNLGTLGPIH
jgi:hypothetical protein